MPQQLGIFTRIAIFNSLQDIPEIMIFASLMRREIWLTNACYRSFSKGNNNKFVHRLKNAGSGRSRRGSVNLRLETEEPKWEGLGWSPILFLGVAPLVAWVVTVAARPDLRNQLNELLGYNTDGQDSSKKSE
jgi:hypothetical protein